MTEKGTAVFNELVDKLNSYICKNNNYQLRSEVELRMKLKVPMRINAPAILDSTRSIRLQHNSMVSEEDIPDWHITQLPPETILDEHFFNSCAVYKVNAKNKNIIDYVVIRAANQENIKYSELYNTTYFKAFEDMEVRGNWETEKARLEKLFPNFLFEPPHDEDIQYPNVPKGYPKPFEMYWGQADLSEFIDKYKKQDDQARKKGIDVIYDEEEFKKLYGRYPYSYEINYDNQSNTDIFIYFPTSDFPADVIFHKLISNTLPKGDGILFNFDYAYTLSENQRDLKNISKYFCSFTHSSPNNETDLLITREDVERTLMSLTDLTDKIIKQTLNDLQQFEKVPDCLEKFLSKVEQYGKDHNDTERAAALISSIIDEEGRSDLINRFGISRPQHKDIAWNLREN